MGIPEIIAHRGSSRECPENTLAAFARALEQRADGIELDVHGTADGALVVHHNAALQLDDAADPRTPAMIREMTLTAVRSARLHGRHPVPLLDDVFDLVGDTASIYVEVKAPYLEGAVAALLNRHPRVRAAVHAFDHRIPATVRALRPETMIGFLSDTYPIDPAAMLRPVLPDALWQQTERIDEALVAAAHERGVKVIAWTENDQQRAQQLATWGVDGLCTDVPATIRAALSARGS